MNVDVNINVRGIVSRVQNSRAFWTFAATEWHRLYRPYVPFKEGILYSSVNITAGSCEATIEHTAPYAHYMYEGRVMGPNVPIRQHGRVVGFFSPVRPKHYTGAMIHYSGRGCAHWDQAAIPTQRDKLTRSLQAFIDRGGMNLSR